MREPNGHGETVCVSGWIDIEDGRAVEAGLVEPIPQLAVGESEPAVGLRFAKEFVRVLCEVDNQETAIDGDEAGSLSDGTSRIVEIVQHLMNDDKVECATVEWRAVDIAMAELALDVARLEVGASDRQH